MISSIIGLGGISYIYYGDRLHPETIVTPNGDHSNVTDGSSGAEAHTGGTTVDSRTTTNTTDHTHEKEISTGTITIVGGFPVEMSGGVALDPYRHNSFSGEQQLYKGVPIMASGDIHLDCSEAEPGTVRTQCELWNSNIERTNKEHKEWELRMQIGNKINTEPISSGADRQ